MKPRYWLERERFARVVFESVQGYGHGAAFYPIFVDVCYRLRAQRAIPACQLLPKRWMVAVALRELVSLGRVRYGEIEYIDGRGVRARTRWFVAT